MAARRSKTAQAEEGGIGGLLSTVFGWLASGGDMLARFKETAHSQIVEFASQFGMLLIVYLWISAGLFLCLLGLAFLLIDLGGIPRGLVFSVGGAAVALVSLLILRFAKQNGR